MLGWSWPTDTRVDYSAPPSSPKHLPSSSQGFVTTKKLLPLTFLAISIWEYHLLQKITAPLVTGVPGVVTSESHVGVLFSRQPSGGLFSPLYRRSHPIFWPPVILISSQLRGGHHRIWHCLTIFSVNFLFSSINSYHDRQNKTAQTIWKLFHVSKIISCIQSIFNFHSDTTPAQWAVWTRPNLLWTVFVTTLQH